MNWLRLGFLLVAGLLAVASHVAAGGPDSEIHWLEQQRSERTRHLEPYIREARLRGDLASKTDEQLLEFIRRSNNEGRRFRERYDKAVKSGVRGRELRERILRPWARAAPWIDCMAAFRVLGASQRHELAPTLLKLPLDGAPQGFRDSLLDERNMAWFQLALGQLHGRRAMRAVRKAWATDRFWWIPYRTLFRREVWARGWAPDVVAMFRDSNARVRMSALEEIPMEGDLPERVRDELVLALLDDDPRIRRFAQQRLSVNPLGGEAWVPALERIANRKGTTKWAREVAEKAAQLRGYDLARKGREWRAYPTSAPSPPSIAEITTLPLRAAVQAIRTVWAREDLGRIRKQGYHLAPIVKQYGWTPEVIALFDDPSASVRRNFAGSVISMARLTSLPGPVRLGVVRMLGDSDEAVRNMVLAHLSKQAVFATDWLPAVRRFVQRQDLSVESYEAAAAVLAVRGYRLERSGKGWEVVEAASSGKNK